jgi:N-acetylneuraminic acid mutarotase
MAAASGYTDSAVASAAYVINLSNFGFVAPHEWTEMSGNDTGTARYGTQGIAAPDNTPGGRSMGMSWTDASGNLWLFGGMTPPHLQELFNDLWKYDPNTQRWMWVNGPENVSPANTCTTVHYGTLGVADPANLPGCRGGGSTWTDAKGRLWMFGGYGSDSTGTGFKLLNDVWMFDPSNVNPRTGTVGVWTWMSGSSSVSTINQGVYNTKGVADPTNTPGGRSRGVSWTDASGKLWLFGGSGFGDNSSGAGMQLNDLWRFDPDAANPVSGVNGVWTWMGGGSTISQANGVWDSTEGAYPSGRDGSAVWVDAGGKFWLFGGQGYSASGPPATLMNDMWVYEPTAANATTGTDGVWTWVGGSSAGNVVSGTPVVGTPSTSYWPGSRCLMQGWADRAGMFWIYGGYGEFSATPPGNLNELWVYNPQTAEWALMSGSTAVHNATAPPVAVREAQGTPDPNANPGYLQGGSGWLDANGNLWLFGGATTGNDSNGNPYSEGTGLNNLWVYDPYAIASPLRRR